MGKTKAVPQAVSILAVWAMVLAFAGGACADIFSYQGSFGGSTDTRVHNFILSVPYTVTVQTYGFGGGTNAAGQVIAPGGFDPLIALFDGSGTIIDGTSDVLLNYSGFMGCPPAGTVTIGTGVGATVCGDIYMSFTLAAGNYTLILTDADYVPNALVTPGATNLSDGFVDFTGGVFQTCNSTSNGLFCITPTSDWAYDINLPVPEPASWSLMIGALGLGWFRRKYKR